MVKTEDIYLNFSGDDNTERIFSLIKDIYDYDTAYHTYDGRIAFVNLMGDTFYGTDSLDDCVPSYPYQNCSRDGGEDIYYAKLTGAAPNYDQYPDLMLGRCSVDTITQIENIVNKITNYAPSSSPNNDLILTFLGEDNSNPFPPAKLKSFENLISNYKDDFKLWLLPDEDQYSSHTCWDTIIPYNRDTLFSIYDGGCLMMNYLGHGSKNAMWPKLSGSLCYSQFINKTPALIPMLTNACCLTGSFQQVDDCLGEEFLLENDSTGAISFIGSKKSSHYSIWKMLMPGIYKPFLEQRIFTAGEIFLSAQLTADIVRSDDNLLGDPAMNLQYENIDTILPDIRIEKYAFNIPDWGMSNDTVVYEILLKNQTYKNIDSVFYCNISYRSFNAGEYISVDSVLVSGIDGYATDTITLQWITTNIENGTYNISIGCDTENKITEQDEDNNNIELDIVIVDVTNHFSIKNNNILNSTPISFNMSCLNENEEIHIGPNIYSIEGTSISTFDKLTRSDVAIGWHTDSLKFIKALIVNGTQKENAFFCVQGANYWSYEFNSKFTDPVFFDINYDGSDEILLLSSDFDSGGVNTQMELRVFDGDGNLDYQTTNFKHIPNINDPPTVREVYNMCVFPGEDIKSAFLPSINEMIYEVRIVNGNILVNDSISRTFDINTPITGYIDENGDRVLVLTDVYNKINDYTKVVQYNFDTKTVIDSCIISKIIDVEYDKNFVFLDDLNNDGMQEMILAKENVGFYIISLSNEISDSIYCKVLPNARPVTLDVNGDNHKDILFLESDTLGFTRFSAIDYSMERIWSIPVMDGIVGSWVSDIDDNGHAELIYSTKKDVLAYEFEENENIIGRQGEHADFRNSGISQYPAYLNQNQCKTWWDGEVYLSDTTIIYSGDSLIIKPYTKIKAAENSQIIVYGTLISDGLSYHPITCNADTAGAGKSYWKGLGFKNGSKSSVSYSNIDNAQYGLYYEDALSYQQLSNSILKNNTVGIGAFNCDPDIKECLVTGNTHGVANYSNSTTGLSGWFNSPQEQFKNKIYNNSNGISIYSSTPLLDHGYNDIYNSPASGNYAIFFYEDERTVLRSTNNYWGTTDTSVINRHLTTPSMFCITPVLDSSYTQYKSGGLSSEQELLISANTLISSSNYNDAKNTLNQLINEYPASGEAVVGLGKLYGCFLKQSTVYEMEEFINALHSIPKDTSMTFSTAIIKAALGYYGLGCRHAGNFESAIHIYDSVLINNPSYNDSVFALINLGNTLIEYEDLYKSTYQHHVFMQNVDRAVHTGLTQDLLLLLKQTEPKEAQFGNNGSINIKISPNPFTQSTSVTIDAPESGRLTVSLYTIGGIKVATITDRQINESGHPIQFEINGLDLNLPGKGIYLLKICIGSSSTTKKIIHY